MHHTHFIPIHDVLRHAQSLSADDLLSLDISNFEHSDPSDAFDQVRRAMIDRTTGDLSLTAWVTVQREVGICWKLFRL